MSHSSAALAAATADLSAAARAEIGDLFASLACKLLRESGSLDALKFLSFEYLKPSLEKRVGIALSAHPDILSAPNAVRVPIPKLQNIEAVRMLWMSNEEFTSSVRSIMTSANKTFAIFETSNTFYIISTADTNMVPTQYFPTDSGGELHRITPEQFVKLHRR